MSRTRYVLSQINLINILLIGVLFFLVQYMLLPFFDKDLPFSLPAATKPGKTESLADRQEQPKTPSPMDFMVVSEQNLFHPERKIPVEVKEAQPLPKPDFVLYGTLISGDLQIAYMEDRKAPRSTPGRDKRQTPLKQGESMSGFILKELNEDRAIMVRGEERLTVHLIDPQQPKERISSGSASAPVSQANQFGAPAAPPPPQASAPQPPSQQTTAASAAQPPSAETAPKIPSAEVREATKQQFLEFFKGGLKR